MKLKYLSIFLSLTILISACRKNITNPPEVTDIYKPQAAGLTIRDYQYILRDPQIDPELLRITNCIVVKVPWRDIQPQPNSDLIHPNIIDDALAYVRQMNTQNPGMNLTLKVRFHCGVLTPAWVKENAGSFILYTDLAEDATSPQDSMMPKFWQPEFLSAFAEVQNKLAAEYDTVPEIREIVDGATGTFYAESFIRNSGNAGISRINAINFINAGWSEDKDLAAIRSSIDAMKAWKKTRVSMAFNEFIVINPPPNVTRESNSTKSIIDYFVSTLGTQGVLGNNGLRDGNAKSFEDWAPGGLMYDISEYMKSQHFSKNIPVYYQTATAEKLGSLKETVERGLEKGAGGIELPGTPNQFTSFMALSQLKDYDVRLEAQVTK